MGLERRHRLDLAGLLEAVEDTSPAFAVSAAATRLEEELGVKRLTLLIADVAGHALLDLATEETIPVAGTSAGEAWQRQHLCIDAPTTAYVPVTVRGDALGVLQAECTDSADLVEDGPASIRQQLMDVGHALGYVLVANQRYTDRYEIARRSEPFNLPMEIQRRLLPSAFVCEGGAFTLAGWLEPSSTAGGDTFDYIVSKDRLTVTLTDAVGHDAGAALLATLTVGAARNARRAGGDLLEQARAAHRVLVDHAAVEDYATGLLLELPLHSVRPGREGRRDDAQPDGPITLSVVNAGHPTPRLLHDGQVTAPHLSPDTPFGVEPSSGYHAHRLEMAPGDRIVLVTDGMLERSAAGLPIDDLLRRTAAEHPRHAVQQIASALREYVGGTPEDDATLLLLDWHGGSTRRTTEGGADVAGDEQG